MATYEELLNYANNYNPQQQQLGVNSFDGGIVQQEETPYQKMMRETYGNPAQAQQEDPGLFGSVVNRMSGQPQQQGAEEPGFLSSLYRGAMAQGIGTLGGQADFVAGATGSETLRNLGDSAQKAMQEYSRPHEYTFNDIFGNGLSSVWKYLSDPNGAAYDVGGGLGSTAAMAAEAALLSAALPSSVAAAGTGAVAAFATRLGLKSVAGALSGGGTAAKLIKNVIASTPLEAASESGGTYREMTTDEQGNRIKPEDLDMDKVQEAMAKNFVGNLGVLGASNLLESVGIGKLFGEKMRQGILGKVRDIGAFMATNAGQNAWEEGAQTGSNLYAQGKIDNISQVVNPFEWNPEQIDAATIGGIAGLGQGTFMGGAGHVLNKIAGPQQQEGNPAVNIQNKVTNEEFGDAVAIAKHDTSTNLVDRMRNLEGRIGHHASDGTNCARTIGLALAGTDYQDLINVDDFVKIAQNKGQLKDPNNYVPKPGDLAVVNDGNHIVMVSENGGTIQNGSSRDGVYESAQSPLQMFGSVKYYISTSDMSSGDYGVAGNLQGVNEEQRQQEYYKNLVAQESQRRADAIREVLGAKTHEQEQQEQAVSEAQKYQQENASELGPINNYYNAFTEQELAALTPEQKQTLKNNFDNFYADKQNWGHTAIEKVQTARGMYNQLLANRQQTAAVQQQAQPQAQQQTAPVVQQQTANATAPATNTQQQVAQPTPTQTANVAQAQTPQVQQQANPVVQQQQTTTGTENQAVQQQEQDNAIAQARKYKTRSEAAKDLPNRIQKAVADSNGDYAKLHSALTTEATDLENDLSFGKITQDEYKTAKAQLDEAQNKYLYNKNNQTTQTDVSPDEWENRLRKATEDLGEAYRNGNITKDEYERRMQEIDDAYDTNVTQKRGFTQYSPDETGFMARQAEEQRAIDENVAKGNRVRFLGMVDDLYKKRKNGQTEDDKKLIASQTNAAFKTGLAMLDKGATAEEAFDAVKDSIGTEKQKAKAKAEAEKQAKAKKGETKNAVTEQKSEVVQKPETGESRNQDVNTQPQKVEQQKGENGEGTESENKVEVNEKPAVSDVKKALQERVNKEFATEEERALAMSVLTDKETPLKALEKRKKENKKRHDQDINDFTEAEYNALQKEGHQGVTLVPLESDPDSGRKKRASNNPKWYQELYASYGGTPSMAAVRRLAIDVLTGENIDVWADRGVPKAAIEQMEPEFEQKRAELDAIDKRFNDEEALLDSITPGIEKINAEMKKEISKYRREAKKTATQQAENMVQSNEEGVNGQNVDDESGLRKLSDGNTAGSVQQNEDGRETGNLSGDENGPGEATLQADDGLVQNEESGTAGDDGRGSGELSGRAAEIRNATDEQNAVRTGNDVEAAQQSYIEELERIDNEVKAGNITQEEAEKLYAENEERLQEAVESTQGDEGASSMPKNTDYQAAATQNEQVKRSLDELITEAKKAFKGAKGFRINRNDLIFTMPNGLEMKVNIEDQILLNAADEAKARKEHGLDEGGITVEGYAKRLDKGSLVALSKDSRIGTAFHEAFHTVWDWALNEKEKAAMLKHFNALAEEQGVSVDEVMADAYRDWLLARQQHRGTVFGKLFQKIKDFINSALTVLTGAENVHNVYRQIESGKVWNRDAKGRFAKAENSEKQFLVTNKKITANTQVPVVDITNSPRFKMDNTEIKKTVLELMNDKNNEPIKIEVMGEGPIGRVASIGMGEHIFNSSERGYQNLKSAARLRALSKIRELLESAIYVEKHPDAVHGRNTKYIELYAVAGNKNNNTMTRFRVVAKEGDPGSGKFEVSDVKFYDIIKSGIVSADPSKTGGSKVTAMPPLISVAQLLDGVKDKNGKPYVVNGKLQYEPGVLGDNTKYSVSSDIARQYPHWMDEQVVEPKKKKEGEEGKKGKKGQNTQTTSTISTYRKLGAFIKESLPAGTKVLDASSGMGLGTKELREMGIDVEDIEPYAGEARMEDNPPTFGGVKVEDAYQQAIDSGRKYDFVISNAVLNVIPDDWRSGVLHNMAKLMNVGGKMFINVRGVDEAEKVKNKIELESPNEILVTTGRELPFISVSPTGGQTKLKRYNTQKTADGKAIPLNEKGKPDKNYTPFSVGKPVGSQIYFHKNYAEYVVPADELQKARAIAEREGFDYNCMMYDKKEHVVRFDEAPDFDTAREPITGKNMKVYPNGKVVYSDGSESQERQIWHHKWMWVADDYQGFDVEESKDWSRKWLKANAYQGKAPGFLSQWKERLKDIGLGDEVDNTKSSPAKPGQKIKQQISAYQRFYTKPELAEYVSRELGDAYDVKIATKKNAGTDGKVAVLVTKKYDPDAHYSIRPSDTPLQRTQKLQAQADRYNAIELNAVTAKDPTARQYMKDQIVKRQLQGLTKKAEKAEAKKRAEKYADDLLEKLDEVVAMVEKVAKRFPAMQDWQNRPIVTITKEERERLKKEKAFRNDVMYRVIDENGKVEPVVNAFKNNAEYPVNMDFGTLCMKKEAIDAVVQILVDKGKGQNLGPTQNEMLKDLLREFGYAVPCDVCFVETKRERMLPDANKTAYAWESVLMAAKINDGKAIGERTSFTEEQEKRLKEMAGQVKGKTFKQAYEEYMPHDRRRTKTNGEKGTDLDTGVTSTAMRKLAKLFLEDPALAGKLEPTTIITSKGTDDLIRIYGGHTNIKNVLSGLYGSANAKPIEGFSVYDALSWILMDNDAITKDWDKLIDMGGGRVQSFSDYNPLLFLEYIQMVVDYQARNMPMHAYTKVPMFAKLFGKTGIMINMSFVPEIIKDEHDTLDEKGKLVHAGLKYNPKTGKFDLYAWHKDSFPIEEALEIRKDKGYAKHVGTIAVGVSDEHIKKMMADPEIDMIIPYHKSGMPAAVQNKTGLKYAKDYTDFQNPGITDEAKEEIVKRLANGDAKAFEKKYGEGAESYLKNRYLNYSRLLVKEGDPEKAAQEYLNRCKDLGCTPVFEMFAYKDGNKEAGIVAPGYYKMLEDFRGYDSEMNPIMQGPVRLYSTDENGEKHLNLPDNVEELLTDSLADRTAQLESLEQLKNNKEFWRKADKLMEMQRADGEVRKAMVDRLSSALGSQNVKTLENGAFLDELEKLYRENGMSEESAKEKVEMFRRFDGAVYGFAKGGAIYLNENYFNANTPAHEFTHIWAKVAQTKNEALWKKGVELLRNTEEWNNVVKDPLYENIIGNDDAIASEVLARVVGERNADFIRDELLDPAKKQGRGEGLWAQIREWMKDIFKSIRSIFDPIKGRRLTYDEFTKMPLKALWDTSEHEQFRESLNELAQQQERADEVHADAIELQVKPGKETAVTIKDGVFTKGPHKGEAVKFADAILDDKKHGETRPKKTLPRNKWVGINRDGMIIGRVKFGDPIEITRESDEYDDAMIENTDYDIEEGQTKWYYPVIDKQDFRKNPIKSEFYSQSLKQYDLPLAQQKEAVREQYKGTDKWMKAPNGKPTNLTEDQWVTTRTPQFKEWFGDSKVVDRNGDPLVVYHGTNADIESFDTSRGGEEGTTRWGKGAYFATGIGTAETYARERAASGGKENIIPCFLKISNLFDNEMSQRDVPKKKNGAWQRLTEFLEQNDVDLPYILENSRLGVAAGIAKKAFGGEQWAANAKFREKLQEFGFDGISAQLEDGTEYVVFNANQIKDASGNNVSITKDSDNIHYSITSTLGKAINKADAYANRNVRKPNENTATGRAAKAFNNTQNKNNAQTFTEWLKDRFTKFYREWIDKNDAIHEVDAAIEKITGKKLAEEDKLYNMVQGSRAYANGAAQTLVEGTPEAFRALRDSLERGIDPKDKTAMDRVNELKKDFKYATMQQVLEPIMTKDMDEKYPSYLEKNGLNNWHDAFSNYLGARRILELVRLVENKSLEFITHDKKEFTDFIDRHPEYEYFRPKAFAKGSWRTQVQKLAQANPKLAEQMAKDLAKQYKFPNGVSRADLEALVAEAPKEFNTSAQVYYQLQRNTLTLMELGHLIPRAVHDQINKMYKEYCPLMIDYSDTAGLEQAIAQFGRGADSIANVGSMLKQVLQLGSERGLISPLESSYKAIQALTERAERNKVAVHFVKTVANSKELQKSGILQKVDKQHSPDAKNCIFTVLIDGKKVAFKTTQDLYGPIVGYDMPAAGIVEGFCRSAAQTLRYGATTSPSFIIRNFIRDTIFAGVSSRNGFVPVLDSARGLWAYWYNQELRGEFDAMGITAYNYFGSGKNAVKSMDKLMGEKDWNYLKSHPTELIKELIKYIPKKFEAASEAIEASTRMGEYMKARKAGKSMQEAALDARDVTLDFSRSGFYGQRVNMMVPFFNACLQGGDKFFKRMVFSKDPAIRMQTARMVGLYIMLPSAILWFFNHDEPWYEELDPHIRMNNWIIGGVRIPKPQEAGIAFGSGIEAMLDKIYNKDPKAGKEWVKAMREVLFPNLIPTVGLPLLEWATNYSLFREKAIEGNRLRRLPTEMRYNSSTTEFSKMVGKATGLSPVKLDNTIRGYTGTLGMLLAQAPDIFFESKQNLPSRPATERVMVRDFFLNDMNMNRTSEEFYELVNTAQQQHAGYGKKGKPTPAVAAVNKALRDVSKQQKEIHMITDAKNISPDRKRQMIDRKREIIRTIQKKTLQRYRDKFNV